MRALITQLLNDQLNNSLIDLLTAVVEVSRALGCQMDPFGVGSHHQGKSSRGELNWTGSGSQQPKKSSRVGGVETNLI